MVNLMNNDFDNIPISRADWQRKIAGLKCVMKKQREKLSNISYNGIEVRFTTSSDIVYMLGETYYKFGHDTANGTDYYVKENCGLETQLVVNKTKRILNSMNAVRALIKSQFGRLVEICDNPNF